MAPKRAKFYSYGTDEHCLETRRFIENAGVLLDVRDIEAQPLSEDEINTLFGNLNLKHFLNTLSDGYAKNDLDKATPPREQVIKLMAEDYTLIRRPIIKSTRLITVGCDKERIAEMLHIGPDGEQTNVDDNERANLRGGHLRNRRPAAAGR